MMSTEASIHGNASDTYGSRKLGLSCAECRRSKLKCDRTFPCQSCIRRGCAGICPDGTLAATKGNKVLMAQAQRLSEQVKSLNSRVRELEAALAQTRHADGKDERQTTPDIDSSQEEGVELVSEAIGSLSLGLDGQTKYHGESAGSEYLQDLLPHEEIPARRAHLDLPEEILVLMHAFPFGFKECPYNKSIFIRYLPPKQRAVELACIYYRTVAWMYDPIAFDDFSNTILEPIYGSDGYPSTDALHSHRLAVFFMIMANGNLYDSHPAANEVAEQYYALARAALSVDSILMEVTCATIQALFLVFRFIYNANQTDKEERWLLTGLATRIAQTVGLQRDSTAWNLQAEEIQRRRRLFWELFVWENWSSLVQGRPGSLFIRHADCKFPEDLDPYTDGSGERELGFHAWKFRYSAECMSVSVEHVFSTRMPPYSALLHIDRTIRNYPIPKHLRCPDGESDIASWSSDSMRALQQYCTLCVRDSNLLYIHRSYFAQAIREASDNPLRHKYKPSVLATYRISCRLISSLKSLYPVCRLCRHVWFFWSGFFSSCVVLGALVVESPGCALAKDAIFQLETAIPFFEEGSRQCRPPSVWNFLQKLYKRAYSSYTIFKTGQDNGGAMTTRPNNEPDELEVLGGRKSVITTKSNSNSPSLMAPGSPSTLHQDGSDGSSPASQQGAADMSMEYYQPMDTHDNAIQETHNFHMHNTTHRFEDLSYSSIEKTVSLPLPGEQQLDSNTYSTHVPAVPASPDIHTTHHLRDQVTLQAGLKATDTWQSSYPLSDGYSHQVSPAFLPYGRGGPLQSPPTGNPYGYQPRPMQEQNQDEIWRTFMLGFGA